ncbi:hypothetical protein JL722_1510 [Aureococcus anophagefferens]|nr:hypothetical protein JL722_1510 [Aureococcus anophagefferens]
MAQLTRGRKSRIRRLADSQELDTFILLAIMFNCVIMAFPPKIFIIKFVAYGFAYFRDTWNQLDFVVVCQGTLSMTTECPYIFGRKGNKLAAMGDISALRMMRVLRPLKSLRKFPEMRLLVGSLFGSFHLLLAIMVLTAMAVFVFAVVATMYFRDAMDYRCLPDPYYDPLRGLFYGNPHANLAYPYSGTCTMEQWQETPVSCFVVQRNLPWGNPLNVTHANYFDSDRNYERYSYMLSGGQGSKRFPYFSSFCGDCDTCYKCPSCYSDDPDTECDRNIRDDFFRRYGDPRNIQATFLGEEPDIPADFFGNPLDYVFNGTDYAPSSWNYENKDGSVKHIAEYCVDLKLATIEQTDPDTGQIYQPKLRLGGIYLTRSAGLMDLTEPQHADISLRYDVANCGEDIRQANRVFEPYENNATICKQTFVDSGRFPSNFYEACVNYPDGVTEHNCQNDYKGKIGELRHGFMGDIAPRHISAVWYLRFDKTFWSLLTIFDIMNMENWNDAMWSIQLCVGKYTWPFFYGVVGFVNICLINLFPAVMSFNLRKAIREEENRIAYEAKAQFMGDEMLTMTQFEEHMIDILAAEEEDIVAVKAYVEGHAGATLNLNAFFDSLRSIVRPETGYFNTFIYTCIFLNLLCMAIEPLHSDERHMKKLQHALDVANEVFVGIFAFEICIKMTALGVTGYFYDAYNCFDFFLGVLSLMDVIHRKKSMSASQLDFARLMGIIASSAIWVVNVLGLLFLCVYMGSIVSMQFFGGEVYALNDYSEQWEKKGRLNFDTFTMAFVTNFVIISADGWNQIMYATMDACGAVTAIYFILLFVVGRYAILSMLIAVIFDQVERDSILVIKQSAQTTMVSIFKFERGLMHMILRFNFLRWYSASRSAFDSDATGSGGGKGNISLAPDPEPPLTPWQRFMSNERSYIIFNPEKQPRKFIKWLAYSEIFTNLVFATIMVSVYVLALFYQYRNTHLDARDKDKSNIATLVSLPENWLLALINTCCRVVFVAEFLVMTIAEGFLSFMSDPMNVLDTTITAISLISLVVPSLSPFAIFRMIRIIRPPEEARAVVARGHLYSGHLHYCSASRYPEGMLLKPFSPDRDRHVGKSYRHWPYPQFQYYDSAYAYPDEPEGDDDAVWANFTHSYKGWPPERVIYPRSSPLANNSFGDVVSYAGWFGIKNAEYNFDNIFEAIRSAFLMFTFDDWHKLILQTINAKTVGPFYNHESQASTIMPVIFFILSGCSSFLITCLFVGAQWSVYESKLSCIKATQEPQEPRSNLLITRLMFRVFRHPNYKVVYACLIFLDIWAWWILAGSQIRLSTKVQQRKDLKDSSNSHQLRTMRSIDNVVSAILLGEFAAKFLVYGWFTTLSLPSEQMRLVLLIPVALYFSLEMSHGWTQMPFFDETMVQRGIYAMRTSQVFLIVPQFVELRMVVQALNCALGTTVPMVALMTIVTFAFAVIGMVAFGDTDISKRYHADNGTEARVFGSYWDVTRVRFSTISKSMNTLFIAATSNNWVAVKDTMKQDALPDDVELTLRREYAQAKLDILRLAVNRYCEPAVRAMDSHGNRVPQAVLDLALMQRARPDVFRYRLRQALTLEAHRWQKQIEFSKFDEESFFECGLLIKSIKEERLSAQMQLEVLHRLAAKGLLMSLQERRPKLHRHVTFLAALLNRVEAERSKHVRKAWLAGSMKHEGTLPVATKHAEGKDRAVSCVAVGGKDGELVVTAHGGRHVTVWKKRKDKKKKGGDDWRAAAREEERKEEARDPWHFSPFYKTQQMTEDLGTCLVVAMTPDGRRFFSSAGEQIRGWVQGKKVRGFKGTKFRCESIMLGHAATVTRLVVAHRHVFSVSEDGTIKIWRFRATDALQTATVSYSAQAMSLAILNTTKPGVPEDYLGLHAVAGLGDGSLCVLPFSLKSQWMQGAVWETKIKKLAFEGREPVTALDVQYRCAAKELERLGYGKSGDAFKRKGGGLDGRATSMLREVVRLDYVFTLDCHSSTITSFCMAGGVLFSAATDMAIVSWMKPVDERNTQFQALGAAGQGAAKYREIVESRQAEADSKNFLEEEILEKPRFFHQLEISKISARHFLAHKRKKKAPGEGDDDDDDEFEDEIADDVEGDDEEYKEDREKSDDEGSEHDDELAGDFDGDFDFGGEDEDYDDLQGDFVGDPVAYEDEDEDYDDEDGMYFGDGFRSYPDDCDDVEDEDIMEDPYAGYDEPSDYATPCDDEAYEDEAYEDEDELSEDDVRLDVGEHFGEDEDEDEDDEEEEDESGSEYED